MTLPSELQSEIDKVYLWGPTDHIKKACELVIRAEFGPGGMGTDRLVALSRAHMAIAKIKSVVSNANYWPWDPPSQIQDEPVQDRHGG